MSYRYLNPLYKHNENNELVILSMHIDPKKMKIIETYHINGVDRYQIIEILIDEIAVNQLIKAVNGKWIDRINQGFMHLDGWNPEKNVTN